MKAFRHVAALLVVLAVTQSAHAAGEFEPRKQLIFTRYVGEAGTEYTTGVNNLALNGSPTSTPIDINGFNVVTPTVILTRVATTTLVLTCTVSLDKVNYGGVPAAGPISSGAGNVSRLVWTFTGVDVSGSGTYNFPSFAVNHRWMKCVLTGASAGASDKVKLQILLGVV